MPFSLTQEPACGDLVTRRGCPKASLTLQAFLTHNICKVQCGHATSRFMFVVQ